MHHVRRRIVFAVFATGLHGCAERSTPFEPMVAPKRPSLTALTGASGNMPVNSELGGDPAFSAALPTYPDSVIAEFRVDGWVNVNRTDNDPNHIQGRVDGQGYYRINGCWMQVRFLYTAGSWGPGTCSATFQGLWVDTAAVQGQGTITRSGRIYQEPYECNYSACWTYNGDASYAITPLSAAINLSVLSGATETAPGVIGLPPPSTFVQLRLNANPLTLGGIQVPIKPISWQWIPKPGGDGQTTDLCTGTQLILCRMVFTETGILVSVAKVNGVEQSDTLIVRAPEIQISAQSGSMRPSVRYTKISGGVVNIPSTQVITVSVIGETGPIPDQTVSLLSTATHGSAGHINHLANTKPRGGFNSGSFTMQLNTGPTGVKTVTFVAPDPSGPVTITGTMSGARKGQASIKVEVPGLVRLPPNDPTYDTTGATTIHPDNHWVTQTHLAHLIALADGFFLVNGKKLTFNDSSLESGGLFDNVDNTGFWTYPHRTHRFGTETDLKTQNFPPTSGNALNQDDKDDIRWLWRDRYGGRVEPEGDHWHLIKN